MTQLTNVLYWISTGLLIPVIVLLLIAFVRSLMMLGGFGSMYISRLKFSNQFSETIKNLKSTKDISVLNAGDLKGNPLFTSFLNELLTCKDNKFFAEKAVQDFEVACEKDLAAAKSITRTGPMLGLMGTLIPMGPALAALASGDITSMAQNMQLAFSTTVVGLLAGALGFIIQLIKKRWYVSDMNNLEFIYNLLFDHA
ncbi:MAG: MotA/TolQ/ExbB proton channel family protein [Bacteroidales bacterium]|nr:MotA/TolQ/ExbB proton channel family protein [Bacteroidales bacterium]